MDWFFQLSDQARTMIVFVVGLVAAGQVNRGIYRLAWKPRDIGPWSAPLKAAPPRRWFDRLPFVGWLFLQREEKLHGRGFWVRPALLEVGLAAALAALYQFEVVRNGLNPTFAVPSLELHQRFFVHAVLLCLMTVATFIDFDDQTIPDQITGPGALAALIFAALWPAMRLPIDLGFPPASLPDHLQIASPNAWDPAWHGTQGLAIGCGIFLGWCWAMVPTMVDFRRGVRNAARYYVASFFRGPYWQWMAVTAVVGCSGIAWVWSLGGERWESLLSQLAGLFFGGMMVWSLRITAGIAMQEEAMGFGDVTLMAMIGAFVGWQSPLLILFLSPAAGVFVAITRWLLTGERHIAFGPYLCFATVFLIVAWPTLWERVEGVYFLGWLVPALFGACLFAMTGMLMLIRIAKEAYLGKPKRRRG